MIRHLLLVITGLVFSSCQSQMSVDRNLVERRLAEFRSKAAGCMTSWGELLEHGEERIAYSASETCSSDCSAVQGKLFCNNGVLIGDSKLQHPRCIPEKCDHCVLPWGDSLSNGATTTAYRSALVGSKDTCQSLTVSCQGGALRASDPAVGIETIQKSCNRSCSVASLDSSTSVVEVPHGQKQKFFAPVLRSACDGPCPSVERTCTDGSFDGDSRFNQLSCPSVPCAGCSDPVTGVGSVPHGTTRNNLYFQSAVGCKETCSAYSFQCRDGSWRDLQTGAVLHGLAYSSCTKNCSCVYGGQSTPEGQTHAFFANAPTKCGDGCGAQKSLVCSDGDWKDGLNAVNPSAIGFPAFSCTARDCRSCSFNGHLIAHQGTLELYRASSVGCSGECQKVSVQCEDGVVQGVSSVDATILSGPDRGKYVTLSCTKKCQPCVTADGAQIAGDATANLFAAATVGCSESCGQASAYLCNGATGSFQKDGLAVTAQPANSCEANCQACKLPDGLMLSEGLTARLFKSDTGSCTPGGVSTCDGGNSVTVKCSSGTLIKLDAFGTPQGALSAGDASTYSKRQCSQARCTHGGNPGRYCLLPWGYERVQRAIEVEFSGEKVNLFPADEEYPYRDWVSLDTRVTMYSRSEVGCNESCDDFRVEKICDPDGYFTLAVAAAGHSPESPSNRGGTGSSYESEWLKSYRYPTCRRRCDRGWAEVFQKPEPGRLAESCLQDSSARGACLSWKNPIASRVLRGQSRPGTVDSVIAMDEQRLAVTPPQELDPRGFLLDSDFRVSEWMDSGTYDFHLLEELLLGDSGLNFIKNECRVRIGLTTWRDADPSQMTRSVEERGLSVALESNQDTYTEGNYRRKISATLVSGTPNVARDHPALSIAAYVVAHGLKDWIQNRFGISKFFAAGGFTDIFLGQPSENDYVTPLPTGRNLRVMMGRALKHGTDHSILVHELGHVNFVHSAGSPSRTIASGSISCLQGNRCCPRATGCHHAFSEGIADYHSAIFFNDPQLGENIGVGGQPIRSLEEIKVATFVPEVTANNGTKASEVHELGQIYGSIWWRVREHHGFGGIDATTWRKRVDEVFLAHLPRLTPTASWKLAHAAIVSSIDGLTLTQGEPTTLKQTLKDAFRAEIRGRGIEL